MDLKNIRNFSIIAHIDHGKSTLADRLISVCGGLSARDMREQVLDSMELERERGITIKAQSVSLNYLAHNGETYQLNMIDTPGHVDFSYEVSRSLASCEGCLLIVDASASVQAQTLANCQTAQKENLVIIPVLNKIDLPSADIERCIKDIHDIVKIDTSHYLTCSAKAGEGVKDILEAIVMLIPSPQGDIDAPLCARIIDSWFDKYLGVVSLIRIYDGILRIGDKIKVFSTDKIYNVDLLGIFTPNKTNVEKLQAGQVGFLVAGIKEIGGAPVGDTIIPAYAKDMVPLNGFRSAQPQIFAGIFTVNPQDFQIFRVSLEKLALNDASLYFQPEVSHALGHGFRCGFLGMLHMDIIRERLEREYGLNLIITAPSVTYKVKLHGVDEEILIDSPSKLPDARNIEYFHEPIALVKVISPIVDLGKIMTICTNKYGVQKDIEYSGNQLIISYEMPLIEVINNLTDKIKSASRGYGSFSYEFSHFSRAEIGVLRVLINDKEVDALSQFVRKNESVHKGKLLVTKLVEIIPRALFVIKIQAAFGAKIIARDDIKALRKDVTGKCYGGDFTRKRKLIEKQKAGKKRMKNIGNVDIPDSAFRALLSD